MRLASILIGRPVLELIEEMRADSASWPVIRQAICDQTSGEVDVTWQAVQAWAREPRDKESDTAA
jgi:hypothetical protein